MSDETGTTSGHRLQPRIPTGFSPLDEVLGGGFRSGDVVLVGGKPGVGKTVLALQWARTSATAGTAVTYVARRERAADLTRRFVLADDDKLTVVDGRHDGELGTLDDVLDRLLDSLPGERDRDGGDGDGAHGDGPAAPQLVVLDDLDVVTGGRLTSLARRVGCVLVALVPCNLAGLASRRTRLHHLGCAPTELYDADVVLVLNDKAPIVSCAHLALDRREGGVFLDRTVVSVEKNRTGPADVHLEFRRDFDRARFEPAGVWVGERLYDERATDH